MFKGEKLQEIRVLYGMSRAELAKNLDITEQAIWQFETNKVSPKISTTVLSLLKIFKVNINFFEAKPIISCVDEENISFQSEDLHSQKAVQMQITYINTIHSLIERLESYLTSPPKLIYSLVEEVNNILYEGKIDKKVINEIADIARNRLGISEHNDDLLYKLELSGINVLSRFNTDYLSGTGTYSLWTNDNTPYLILAVGKSFARRNFDLAHELGHLLLHRAVEFDILSSVEQEQKEQEANMFALKFLLPDTVFRESFETLVGNKVSQPDRYISLKQHFNVSIQTLEYKAFKLGYLTPAQNSYFYRQIHKKKYNVVEPLDRDITVYKAGKILNMLDIVLKNNLTNIQALTRSMLFSKELLAKILNVEETFFDRYETSARKYSPVIRMPEVSKRKDKDEQ